MNKLCQMCQKGCKQAESALIVECKRYCPAPVQMVIKFKSPKKPRCLKCDTEA